MPTFTTAFTPPPAVSDFEITANIDRSAVDLGWGASSVAQVDFGGFRIYRSDDGGLTWLLLQSLPLVTDTAYSDYQAPLNETLFYRVTQSNLDFESDPVEGAVTLASLQWQVVVPGDSSLTFSIDKMRSADLVRSKSQDVFLPVGRPSALVVGDVVHVESGEITVLVMPDNLAYLTLLRRVQDRMEGSIVLKATDGSVWEVQYGDMRRTFTRWGGQELTIPFIGVG